MMMAYLEYVSRRRDKRGIIEIGLGDWLPVNGTNGYDALLGFTDSTYVYDICKKAEIMFNAVGLNLNADYAKAFGAELFKAIRKEYINTDTMTAADGCQTSQAMGIYYDIFTASEKPEAVKTFIDRINKDNKKLTCGCLGTRVFYHVLAQNGYEKLAYDMITDSEFPSYAYWINLGKTTMPEQFIIFEHEYIRSENHHFLGDVLQWFMRYLGGINIDSYNEVTIKPYFAEKLDYVKCEHTLPLGTVKVYWARKDDRIELNIECPESIKCNIIANDNVKIVKE